MNDNTALIALIESVRDDVAELRREVRALADRPALPGWVRAAGLAALTAVIGTIAGRYAAAAQLPAPQATVVQSR